MSKTKITYTVKRHTHFFHLYLVYIIFFHIGIMNGKGTYKKFLLAGVTM